MKITDPVKIFDLEWNRRIEQIGSLEGPKGDKGDKGESGKDGRDGRDADVGTHVVSIKAVDKPYTFVLEYNTGETEEITLEFNTNTGTYVDPTPLLRKREVYISNAYYDDGNNLVLVKADGNIILPPTGNTGGTDNLFIQEDCPDVDYPNLWIKTCPEGKVNLLLKV